MPQPPKPCITCSTPTPHTRCPDCQATHQRQRPRTHYRGDYARRARHIRQTATHCWICHQPARPNDPWQADHINPGDPTSPLLPAHRSCNIRRSNQSR